ncbi:MAG: hypothetical protein ABIB43_01965 [archaeon]
MDDYLKIEWCIRDNENFVRENNLLMYYKKDVFPMNLKYSQPDKVLLFKKKEELKEDGLNYFLLMSLNGKYRLRGASKVAGLDGSESTVFYTIGRKLEIRIDDLTKKIINVMRDTGELSAVSMVDMKTFYQEN